MTSSLLPDPATRALATAVADLQSDVDQLKQSGRSAGLGQSTLDGGSMVVRDQSGMIKAVIGTNTGGDGDPFAITILNGPPPTAPTGFTLEQTPSGLMVNYPGTHSGGTPVDYAYTKVYVSQVSPVARTPATFAGRLYGDDSLPLGPLDGGATYFVVLTSVNTSNKEGDPSVEVAGTAGMVVAQQVLDGIVNTLSLADEAVVNAKIAAGAVTGTKVADNSISSPKIIAGGVQTINLAADSVAAGKVAADAITAREIQSLTITANEINTNAITAGKISAGAVTAVKLEANMVMTTRLIVGNMSGARVEIHPTAGIQAFQSNGTTRTFHVDPATGNVTATGTFQTGFSGERLVLLTDGTQRFYRTNGSYSSIENNGSELAFRGNDSGNAGHLRLSANYVAINYGQLNGTVPASFGADGAGIQSWGRLIGFRYEQRYAGDGTAPRIFMLPTHSNGSDNGGANIHILDREVQAGPGFTGPIICAPGQNGGITFNGGIVGAVTNVGNAYQRFVCAGFDSASSERLKENIQEVEAPEGRSSWDIIEGAPSRDWHYRFQREELDDDVVREPDGRPQKLRKRNPRYADPIYDDMPDSEPKKWVYEDWVRDPNRVKRPRKKHRFPIAEDLAALDPELVNTGLMGTPEDLTVDLRDLVGVHHDAIDMLIKRIRMLEGLLAKTLPQMKIPPRPQKGDVVEGVGKVVPGRTVRIIDPETGQRAGAVRGRQ